MRCLSRRNACQIYSRLNVFSVLQCLWTCWCEWRHMTEASTTHTTVMIQISKEDSWLPTLLQLKIVFDFVTDNCTVKLIVNYTTITFYWVNTPWRKYEGGYRACNKKRTKVYTYFIRCPTFGSKSGIGNPDKLPVAQDRLLCQLRMLTRYPHKIFRNFRYTWAIYSRIAWGQFEDR